MDKQIKVIVFCLDEQRYALPLESIERTLRAVEITPLPKGPAGVLGLINLQGKIIPVFNLRERFGLPLREMRLSDQFIVALVNGRLAAFLVDSVIGVVERDAISVPFPFVEGVIKLDGMILIHDLNKTFAAGEIKPLEEAM